MRKNRVRAYSLAVCNSLWIALLESSNPITFPFLKKFINLKIINNYKNLQTNNQNKANNIWLVKLITIIHEW